jgi:hypothetical protein
VGSRVDAVSEFCFDVRPSGSHWGQEKTIACKAFWLYVYFQLSNQSIGFYTGESKMDQSELLSMIGGMYDKLVHDVSNRVYAMMVERDRSEIDYDKIANILDWKKIAKDVAANFSASDIASEIDLGDLASEIDLGDIAEILDVEKIAIAVDMEEQVREVLRGL